MIDLLDRLHRPKDRAYGDAWRRRGEVLGIFANIARKADRLETAMAEAVPSRVEALPDTAADFAVYVGKYLTWLAESHPESFEASLPGAIADRCSAQRGPDALVEVLKLVGAWERARQRSEPRSTAEAWSRAAKSFAILERGLVAQAGGGGVSPDPTEKASTAWDLLSALVWFLVRLAEEDVPAWDGLMRTVGPAAME